MDAHARMAQDCWNLIKALASTEVGTPMRLAREDDVDDAARTLIELACDSAVEAISRERAEQQAYADDAIGDLTAKLQWLVNWLDHKGHLPEHLFTFPDGDVWEATRADACVCRTSYCGHPASAHHEGVCEICRVVCWS